MEFDNQGEPVVPIDEMHAMLERATYKERMGWLIACGWRQGRDGLWRNDTYGGSYKLDNAITTQLKRPVGDPASIPVLPQHFVTVMYDTGERRGCWVTGKTPSEAISRLLGRKAFKEEEAGVKYVTASQDSASFDENLLTLTEINERLRTR